MSAQTDIVQRAHQALNDGDMDALAAICDADFRLDMSDRVFNPEVYTGHEGIKRFYAEVTEVWESFSWDPIELHEFGDLVLALVHSRGKGRGSGLELDRRSAMLWRLENDRALAMTFYRDPEKGLGAARAHTEPE